MMRSEPAPRAEPPSRVQRTSPPPLAMPVAEEPMQWSAEPEPPQPPPLPARERRPRTVDPLAGLAEELARVPSAPEPSNIEEPPRQPPRRVPRPQPAAPPPQPAPAAAAEAQFNSSADQNLAEMAQRLEAALRRPVKNDDARPQGLQQSAPKAAAEPQPAESEEDYAPAAPVPPPARPAAEAARPPRAEAKPARVDAKPAPQKSLYDSLEQEMASLLGRPNTKP